MGSSKSSENAGQESSDAKESEHPCGEEVVIPEVMVTGSKEITRAAHDSWAAAYHELAAELGIPDLAAAVQEAVSKAASPDESPLEDDAKKRKWGSENWWGDKAADDKPASPTADVKPADKDVKTADVNVEPASASADVKPADKDVETAAVNVEPASASLDNSCA